MPSRKLLPAFLLALTVASCKSEPPEAAAPVEPREPPKVAAPVPAAEPSCIGPVTAGTPKTLTLGAATWELNGSTLALRSPLAGGKLAIGAITDIKEDTEENKANLRALMEWFAANKVDLIVVAGDTGETQAQIENALDVLAAAEVPVLNIIGNRELKGDYRKAMTAAAARHPNVLDLSLVRRIDTPAADIVSMPGYFNPAYIHSGEQGCLYAAEDLAKIAELVKSCDSPVVLVSHGGPKQDGADAIDRTAEGANVGDPELTKLIQAGSIPFGIFGNIHEAGGRATDLAGKTLLEEGKPYDALFLNPGPADAVRWMMNDGSESGGMGALLTVQDGKASYAVRRLGDEPAVAKKGKLGKKSKKQKIKKGQ